MKLLLVLTIFLQSSWAAANQCRQHFPDQRFNSFLSRITQTSAGQSQKTFEDAIFRKDWPEVQRLVESGQVDLFKKTLITFKNEAVVKTFFEVLMLTDKSRELMGVTLARHPKLTQEVYTKVLRELMHEFNESPNLVKRFEPVMMALINRRDLDINDREMGVLYRGQSNNNTAKQSQSKEDGAPKAQKSGEAADPFNGYSPLDLAIKMKNRPLFDMLFTRDDLDVNKLNAFGRSPLMELIREPDLYNWAIELVKNTRFNVNQLGANGQTVFTHVLERKDLALMEALLSNPQFKPEYINYGGNFALAGTDLAMMLAPYEVYNKITFKLIEKDGFDPNKLNHKDQTIFERALRGHQAKTGPYYKQETVQESNEALALRISKHPKFNPENNLAYLSELPRTKKQITDLVAANRGDINARNTNGETLLMWAARDRNRLHLLKQLLSRQGIDVNLQDVEGRTALSIAILENNFKAAEILAKRLGTVIFIRDYNKKDSIVHAMEKDAIEVFRIFWDNMSPERRQAYHVYFSGKYGNSRGQPERIRRFLDYHMSGPHEVAEIERLKRYLRKKSWHAIHSFYRDNPNFDINNFTFRGESYLQYIIDNHKEIHHTSLANLFQWPGLKIEIEGSPYRPFLRALALRDTSALATLLRYSSLSAEEKQKFLDDAIQDANQRKDTIAMSLRQLKPDGSIIPWAEANPQKVRN